MSVKRVFVIVLDSYGCGYLPDAAQFGDVGANTLASIARSEKYDTPNMEQMGLFNIDEVTVKEGVANPSGAYGRLAEASMGKDTTTGHWEIAGIISPSPCPPILTVFRRKCSRLSVRRREGEYCATFRIPARPSLRSTARSICVPET